jgi:outer membrane usher protein
VTFGQTLGETVALVEAKDAQGARITNSSGATVDGQGYGVVPYLSAYSRNRIELDPEGLSRDVELKNTSSEAIPVAGSVIKVKFETSKEKTLLINAKFSDGKPLPFGAEVIDSASKNLVGYVGQAGNIFARGVGVQGQLLVKLKDRDCQLDYKEPSNKDPSTQDAVDAIISINAVCLFE